MIAIKSFEKCTKFLIKLHNKKDKRFHKAQKNSNLISFQNSPTKRKNLIENLHILVRTEHYKQEGPR